MYIPVFMFIAITLIGGGFGVSDEEFQVGFITSVLFIYNFCHSSSLKISFTQPYSNSFQSLSLNVADIIEQFKDEIRKLKQGLEKEIQRNK